MSDRRYNILNDYLNPWLFDLKIFPGGFQDSSLRLNGSQVLRQLKEYTKKKRIEVVDCGKMKHKCEEVLCFL